MPSCDDVRKYLNANPRDQTRAIRASVYLHVAKCQPCMDWYLQMILGALESLSYETIVQLLDEGYSLTEEDMLDPEFREVLKL